jgi:hypothetical protein
MREEWAAVVEHEVLLSTQPLLFILLAVAIA